MNSYEERRLEKIKKNQALLAELDIKPLVPPKSTRVSNGKPPTKRRKISQPPSAPSRTSARIASAPSKPIYDEDADTKTSRPKNSTKKPSTTTTSAKQSSPQPVPAHLPQKNPDEMHQFWTSWTPSADAPTRDEDNVLHFPSHPSFTPNKTPEEMLREGAFGGSYYRRLYTKTLHMTVEGDWEELPSTWLEGLDVGRYVTSSTYDADVNKFKVSCGQSIEQWEAAGWIAHAHDVRGWFQWYIRFFLGRRCEDDERQVSRWRKCVGPTGRWRRMLLKKYVAMGVREVFDDGEEEEGREVSPVMHQTCHHWGYEVRQGDLERYWETGT